jgi:hypothetical protein
MRIWIFLDLRGRLVWGSLDRLISKVTRPMATIG